ncbi:MAG TPA: hypothetical protein VMV49_06235 [Candidatus Deferrimicrobium sp.]|nr:hypothetical protein [Candidatus Deferrimicrobium sp.]
MEEYKKVHKIPNEKGDIKKGLITGVIYSHFDVKAGPMAVAWIPPDISFELKDLISLKSINILVGEDGFVPSSLAIIPFPSQGVKGIIKSIEVKDPSKRGGAVNCSLTVIFNDANDLIFYRYINDFEELFNETASKIVTLVEAKSAKQQLDEVLKLFYLSLIEILVNCLMKYEGREKVSKEPKRSLLSLFNLFPKDLDKVINALLLGETVIVSGEKEFVKLIIDTLTLFNIEGNFDIIYWTKEPALGNIVGCPPSLLNFFKKEIILDLYGKKVIEGKSNNFCRNLINNAKRLDSKQAEKNITDNLQKIHHSADILFKMVTENKLDSHQLEIFTTGLDLDELDFIETYAKLQYSQHAKDITKAVFACRKKMSKILSGFGKQKW